MALAVMSHQLLTNANISDEGMMVLLNRKLTKQRSEIETSR